MLTIALLGPDRIESQRGNVRLAHPNKTRLQTRWSGLFQASPEARMVACKEYGC